MHVSDRPVGIVRQRVDALDAQQRSFKSTPVEGNADDEELEDRVDRNFAPGSTQCEKTIDHSTPGWHPKHDGKEHPSVDAHSGSAV